MLTDSILRSQVDSLWNKLWSGGLSNPLDAIEQFSYLLFMKRLEEQDMSREQRARLRGQPHQSLFPEPDLRWSHWKKMTGDRVLSHVKEKVFPFIRTLGGADSVFAAQMANAEFKINKPTLLLEACNLIDEMKISSQNQDVQGDLYEHLLEKLNTAGRNGQFRTPRHIIRMMVQMIDPRPGERICDPAAGTGGFLVNAYQHILETHTCPEILTYDEKGMPHHLVGELLTEEQNRFLQTKALTGYDNDSGMAMLRIGSMNLMLHGIERPNFRYMDTLSKAFNEARQYNVILANPPFKGAIDAADVNPTLPTRCKKTELLFLHLFLRLLEMGGRAGVIVPDGVLFGSGKMHIETRKLLIDFNRLEGVVSMPSGVFKPYAGVSTAVLIFTKGGTTDRIWFYDMEHDGFSLDDKRQPTPGLNDIPDILACWQNRRNPEFAAQREARLAQLRAEIEPLKAQRLRLQEEVHRLTFERAIAPEGDTGALERLDADERRLAELETQIQPLQREINQLTRHFWVTKARVRTNKYDLSASRYRQIERNEVFYDKPCVTIERIKQLECVTRRELSELERLLHGNSDTERSLPD